MRHVRRYALMFVLAVTLVVASAQIFVAQATPQPVVVTVNSDFSAAKLEITNTQASATLVTPERGAQLYAWAPDLNVLNNQLLLTMAGRSGAGPLQGASRYVCVWGLGQTSPADCGTVGEWLDISRLPVHAIYFSSHRQQDGNLVGQWFDMGDNDTSPGGVILRAPSGVEIAEQGSVSTGYINLSEGRFYGIVDTRDRNLQSFLTAAAPAGSYTPMWEKVDTGIRFPATINVRNDQFQVNIHTDLPGSYQLYYLPAEGANAPDGGLVPLTEAQYSSQMTASINGASQARGTFVVEFTSGSNAGKIAWIDWDNENGGVTINNVSGQPYAQERWQIVRQIN